jgi:SET domain-containing protein
MSALFSTKIFLQKIPEIDGWGVFTKEIIKTGETIETSPVFLYPKKLIDMAIYLSMSEGYKESDIGIDRYAVLWDDTPGKETSAIMMGYLSLYNHSNNNNSYFTVDPKNRLVSVIAAKDINPGSQLTVSYGKDWFEQKKAYINYIEF